MTPQVARKPEQWKSVPSCWFDFAPIYDEAVATAPRDGVLVELGSFWGQSALYLAEAAKLADKNLRVYCVDTWSETPENNPPMFDRARFSGHVEPDTHGQFHDSVFETFAHMLDKCRPRLSPDPLRVLRMDALEAAELLAGVAPLHFVFLDDDHSYEHVLAELDAFAPLMSASGIIAGHDWTEEFWGVEKAVKEFFGSDQEPVHVECGRSWVVRL